MDHITWISSTAFNAAVDPREFEPTIQPISGRVLQLDPAIFDVPHERVENGAIIGSVLRWCGEICGRPFYLELYANDLQRLLPMSFNIIAQGVPGPIWAQLKTFMPVIRALGKVSISHIGGQRGEFRFALLRDNPIKNLAEVICRYSNEAEGPELLHFMVSEFNDTELMIATCNTAQESKMRKT